MGNYIYNKLEIYLDEIEKKDDFYDLINFLTKEEIEGLSELDFSFYEINPRLYEFIKSPEQQEEELKTSNIDEETNSIYIDKEELCYFSSIEELTAVMKPICYIYKHWHQEINNRFKIEVYFISYRFEISHILFELSKKFSSYTFKYSFLDQGWLFGGELLLRAGEECNYIDLEDMSEEYSVELQNTLNINLEMLNFIDITLCKYEVAKDPSLLPRFEELLKGEGIDLDNFKALDQLNNNKIFIEGKIRGEIMYYSDTNTWRYTLDKHYSKDYKDKDAAVRDLRKRVYTKHNKIIDLI